LIAQYWTVYLNKKTSHGLDDILDGKDVAIMLTLMKIARMSGQKYKRDNVVDAIGYLAILADRLMADVTESKEEPI
jgi:hypothetical protein